MKRILVTGTGGATGSYFSKLPDTVKRCLILKNKEELDVRKQDAVREMVEYLQCDFVIHLAAETDVDRCEKEQNHAYVTNVTGTQNIALACQRKGIGLLYVSTAAIFGGDGRMGPFSENDTPCPANFYANTKMMGEKVVRDLVPRHYIVRAGWMFGGYDKDKKFISKIVAQAEEGKKLILAVNDKYGSLTYAKEFVGGLLKLIDTGQYGTYHMVNKGVPNRFQVAEKVVSLMGGTTRVESVPSSLFPLVAPRPNSEALRSSHIKLFGKESITKWEDALTDYLSDWRKLKKIVPEYTTGN